MEARREQPSGRPTGAVASADRDVRRRSGGSCTVSLRIRGRGGDDFAEAGVVVLRHEKEEEVEMHECCKTALICN